MSIVATSVTPTSAVDADLRKKVIVSLPPSVFIKEFPWCSKLQKTESEIIASNIMKIRARLGDKWDLTWKEYALERKKDGQFSYAEKEHFEAVMPLISDAVGAIAFSDSWAKLARKALGE